MDCSKNLESKGDLFTDGKQKLMAKGYFSSQKPFLSVFGYT